MQDSLCYTAGASGVPDERRSVAGLWKTSARDKQEGFVFFSFLN